MRTRNFITILMKELLYPVWGQLKSENISKIYMTFNIVISSAPRSPEYLLSFHEVSKPKSYTHFLFPTHTNTSSELYYQTY